MNSSHRGQGKSSFARQVQNSVESNPRARNGKYEEGAREPALAGDLSVKFNDRVTRELVLFPCYAIRVTPLPFRFNFRFEIVVLSSGNFPILRELLRELLKNCSSLFFFLFFLRGTNKSFRVSSFDQRKALNPVRFQK